MADFTEAMAVVFKHEGGFAPEDNGRGAVNFGITQATYDGTGYSRRPALEGWPAKVANLTPAQAKVWYKECYWAPRRLDQIDDQRLAVLVFSLALNTEGPGGRRAVRWLQEAVGIKVDGIIGPITVGCTNRESPYVTIACIKMLAWEYYHELAKVNPKLYADDLPGWMDRLADLTGDDSIRIRK